MLTPQFVLNLAAKPVIMLFAGSGGQMVDGFAESVTSTEEALAA